MQRRFPQIKLPKVVRLNIGCGKKLEKDFINIDIRDCGQDLVWDVREGIPFPNNSVDMIWSQHVMEHFTNDESKDILAEMCRVLKVGGTMIHVTPHASDPTSCYFDHETFWNEQRVWTINGLPGCEGLEVIKNTMDESNNRRAFRELTFELRKVK